MRLLLTSSGLTNETIRNSFRQIVHTPFDSLSASFIPTAANVEPGDKRWLIEDIARFSDLGFASFDIVDISVLPQDVWKNRLSQTDVLIFGGGNTFYLMHWLEKSGLKETLPQMLRNKIYVGISAGSMVTTKKLTLTDSAVLYSEDIGDTPIMEGLGFVDFTIRPHLNSSFFTQARLPLMEKIAGTMKEPLYAIDDATAIVVEDDKVTVVSEGTWKKFN